MSKKSLQTWQRSDDSSGARSDNGVSSQSVESGMSNGVSIELVHLMGSYFRQLNKKCLVDAGKSERFCSLSLSRLEINAAASDAKTA